MRQLIFLVLCCLASASAIAQPPAGSGEMLLLPAPPETGWTTRSASLANEEIAEWMKPETGDVAAARILRDKGQYPASRYKETTDSQAKSTCRSYGSRDLGSNMVNGYQHGMWIAECVLDVDKSITVLHLFITGRDYGYYLTRKWRGTPAREMLELWVNYFSSVSVCDTRQERGSPCPAL